MSLITQLNALVTRLGTEFKNVYSITGALSGLTTTAKTSLVVAVNETVTNIALCIPTTAIGAANGVCGLDSGSRIPAAYLPSSIDELVEYANMAGFPGTGVTQTIYLAKDTNHLWRWTGSAYVDMSGAGGGLASFNGRATAAAVPTAGDYDAFYYTQTQLGDPTTNFVTAFNTALT
jgi:hypothetical protein